MVKLQAQGTDIATSGAAVTTLLSGDVGRKLSMHVVAACPLYLAPKDVPADIVARETAIFRYCLCTMSFGSVAFVSV